MLAEWTKIRSVRSTTWSLVIFVVLTLGLTALFTWLTVHALQNGHVPRRRGADLLADPVSFILGTGLGLGQLAICVLGVLTITTEYSTGVIRASLLAVPRRLPMLAAKGVVFSALIFVLAEIVSFCSFFIGKVLVHPVATVSLSQPGVTRAVIGAGLYLTVLALFALAIGTLIRHTAGAIAIVIGLVLVVPGLLSLLDSYDWGSTCSRLVPHRGGRLHHSGPSAVRAVAHAVAGVRCLLSVDSSAASRCVLRLQAPRRVISRL